MTTKTDATPFAKFYPVNGNTSKADEIALLYGFANLCQQGSYLNGLFSREFVTWVEENIKNDFPPDMFDHLKGAREEVSKYITALAATERRISELVTQRDQANEKAREAKAQATELVESYRAMVAAKQAELDKFIGQAAEREAELIETGCELTAVIDAQRDKLTRLESEIVTLKAKMYDLLTK